MKNPCSNRREASNRCMTELVELCAINYASSDKPITSLCQDNLLVSAYMCMDKVPSSCSSTSSSGSE
ncbi:hypothetical protein EHQ57_05585 [Leptospira wolffii]|nr:hypothetical protein [Leptospira wolffii]TGL30880.1 hypothetical protein EHQ57_05585 [Leptospira wolffii]